MATSPLAAVAIAGSQSLAGETETVDSGVNVSPVWTAASTSRLLFGNPCQASHTRPDESVAATGKRSVPGSVVRRISDDIAPSARELRAQVSHKKKGVVGR